MSSPPGKAAGRSKNCGVGPGRVGDCGGADASAGVGGGGAAIGSGGGVAPRGKTDWRMVWLIISRTDLDTDEQLIAKVQSLAARIGGWRGWSRQRITNAVDTAVRRWSRRRPRTLLSRGRGPIHCGLHPRRRDARCLWHGGGGVRPQAFVTREGRVPGRPSDIGSAPCGCVGRFEPGTQRGLSDGGASAPSRLGNRTSKLLPAGRGW